MTTKNLITALRDALHEAMATDPRVVVLGEDVGARGGVFRATQGLVEEFGPERVVDMPLAENAIIGVAIGMALDGLRPIAEIEFADFIHPAFDQIVSEAARMRYRSAGDATLPLVIRVPWGGGVHGGLYHSQSIESFYAHVPGLKVIAPSTPADVAGMLHAAIADPDPVLFLEHKATYRLVEGEVADPPAAVPIGPVRVARTGEDLSVFAYGLMLHRCLEAAERLRGEGFSAEVIDVRTLSPLDREGILASVRRTGKALVVHEDSRSFGAGAEIAATIAEGALFDLDGPVVRLTGPDAPAMPFARALEDAYLLDTERIHAAMLDLARF